MKWVYIIAGIALFFKMLLLTHPSTTVPDMSNVAVIVEQSHVPNAVSGVIFRNRLYDTIFEVVTFTLAIIGVTFLLADETPYHRIKCITDRPTRVLAQLGATITAIIAIELSVRGHLSPGGGFSAGVAGGTALGLLSLTSLGSVMDAYKNSHAVIWEKAMVLIFLLLALFILGGLTLPRGEFGTLLSGQAIPLFNVLVAAKVMLGSWTLILTLVRYRGLI